MYNKEFIEWLKCAIKGLPKEKYYLDFINQQNGYDYYVFQDIVKIVIRTLNNEKD